MSTNSGTHVSVSGLSGETAACSASEQPLTVTTPTLVNMTTSGGDEGTLSLTWVWDLGPFECHFDGSGEFTYGTGPGNDVLRIESLPLTSDEFCEPEEGSALFEGDFTVTTTNDGQPVWFQ